MQLGLAGRGVDKERGAGIDNAQTSAGVQCPTSPVLELRVPSPCWWEY